MEHLTTTTPATDAGKPVDTGTLTDGTQGLGRHFMGAILDVNTDLPVFDRADINTVFDGRDEEAEFLREGAVGLVQFTTFLALDKRDALPDTPEVRAALRLCRAALDALNA